MGVHLSSLSYSFYILSFFYFCIVFHFIFIIYFLVALFGLSVKVETPKQGSDLGRLQKHNPNIFLFVCV